jgi:hypothetical protein
MPYHYSNTVRGKTGLITILIVILSSLSGCLEDDSALPAATGWSSLDPAAIPLRQRTVQAHRGNLVRNPSFEQGRIVNIASNTVSKNITGWTWIGTRADWVSEARTGAYAIKVHKESADETRGQGEGIISDFIRIIPGNYTLTFWIRLSNIHSYQERRGTRIDDAVDVRVLYYDKNRLLISGKAYNTKRNANIDLSFKALPFAGFWNIDSLGWSRVVGRTTNDFLTEGDVPDEAKFAKIFFSLKGTGTMWIDDVDFRYSMRNFTSLERSEGFFDTTFTVTDMLVPAPKRVEELEPLVYHYPGTDSLPYPVIVIPQRASRQTLAGAGLLRDRLEMLFERLYGPGENGRVVITRGFPDRVVEEGGLVFHFANGQPSRFQVHDTLLEAWGRLEQGYLIQPDSLKPNLVNLIGSDGEGDFYAAVTASQLLDEGRFVYFQSSILDYPDIPQRSFVISAVSAATDENTYEAVLSEMLTLKMNQGYVDYYRSRNMWEGTGTAYLRGLNEIGKEAAQYGLLRLSHMVNPYAFLPFTTPLDSLEPGLLNRWMHSDPASFIKLQSRIRAGLQAGASTVVICTHDHLPFAGDYPLNFSLYADRDRNNYVNLQQAHLEMIRNLFRSMGLGRTVKLEFIAPWYANEQVDQSRGQAEQYLTELSTKLPESVSLLWSGPARMSNALDDADLHRYNSLTGRDPILWDNSLNALPRLLKDTSLSNNLSLKLRTLSIFEPYRVNFAGSRLMGSQAEKIIINSPLDSEIMKIRVATAADYLWNTESYDPDLSLWKVLISRYGREAGMNLYRFNESYMTLIGSLSALKRDPANQRFARQIHDQLEVMQETLAILEGLIPMHARFLNELKRLKLDLDRTFEAEVEAISTQVMARLDSI